MEGSGEGAGNVSQTNGYPAQPSTAPRKLRAPTVHEALPYTPLSSIVPFTPDVIPAPVALPTPSSTAFSTWQDVKNAQGLLKELSNGAMSAETASKRCQHTLQAVQKLLDPDSLTKFKFKRRKPAQTFEGAKSTKAPTLPPFAKMVLESTNVSFRYLTPESEPDVGKLQNGVATQAQVNEATKKGYVVINQNQTPTVQLPTPSATRMVEAVIPSSVTPAQQAQYQYVSGLETLAGAKQVTPSILVGSARGLTTDQRQKGDLAVKNLQNLLLELFEAEDQLQPDTSGAISNHANAIFAIRDTEDGSMPILQPDAQIKLDSFVNKVVSYNRLENIEIEQLVRAQRLCESPVALVESQALQIGEDWSDSDMEEWLLKLGAAESGMIAARTMVRIMTGGAQQKELQSEELLRKILESLKTVIEGCIIPIVEEPPFSREKIRGEKELPPPNPKFEMASSHRKNLLSLLSTASKILRLLGELLVKVDIDDTTISSVEYLCKTLIFAENASTDRESALGIQNFETIRRCAMDVLAKIFTKYTDQRQFIFDEILMSLEKLPPTKQSARQYRLTDAKPIQLVSALLMRLVQTSATSSNEALKLHSKAKQDGEDDESAEESEVEDSSEDEDTIKVTPANAKSGAQDLMAIVMPLHKAAQDDAMYIIRALTRRAINTSKSSDEPYRKLLDIFTEDFLNVLGSPDWPAAELLLRSLVLQMMQLVKNDKSSVPSRNLALEMLGNMGSGILELRIAARDATRGISSSDAAIGRRLCDILTEIESSNMNQEDLAAFDGPFRYVIQYLEARSMAEDAQLQTARGYHLTEWAFTLMGDRAGSVNSDDSEPLRSSNDLRNTIQKMFADPKWLDNHVDSANISTSGGRLAAMILTLNSSFCKAFNRMFSILLESMTSEQSTVKSRSLKSVIALLEKDPGILDRSHAVLNQIYHCATDKSPLVRDSALGLIDKCLNLRPALNATAYKRVIERTKDAATTVRKRALKMLKDIYLRSDSNAARSEMANAIISRIEDTEESVIELARTTIEEIWFQPFYGLKLEGDRAVQARLAYSSQAALLIETVEQSDEVLQVLEALLKRLLSTSKLAEANLRVCKTLVTVLFDGIIDNTDIPGSPTQDSILRSLTIFARAGPGLFTSAQLERLEPYTQNLTKSDDLDVYRSVITILRNVMPYQPTMNDGFLNKMQTTLLLSVTKLQKPELREVAPCLWTINGMLGNIERLVNFMISVLGNISKMRGDQDLNADEKKSRTLAKLMGIAGEFGNACDFNDRLLDFKEKCKWANGDSVPGIIVETLCPFTSPRQSLSTRLASLEAICTISQAWPKQFLRADVTNAFEIVFKDQIPELEEVLLSGLEGFFRAQEAPEESDDMPELGSGIATGTERLGRTYVASDHDGASTSLAQRFLKQILHIALKSRNEPAFIAARLIVSINKQGLVHPKESSPALVALGTCPNKAVANEAFKEHKAQHSKHESVFEKEYMRAVQQTFEYQQGVIGDAAGYTGHPPTSKLHLTWEVLKGGKAQVRKKFLTNIAQKMDFDPAKSGAGGAIPSHVLFVRFCLQNLAFFDYDKVDDLLHLISGLDKIFAGTGSTIAQAIESEVMKLQVEGLNTSDNIVVNATSDTAPPPSDRTDIDSNRLRQLALSSQILCSIWETRSFLVRVWNLQKHLVKSKQQVKDVSKAPNRSTNTPSFTESYLRRLDDIAHGVEDEDSQRRMCSTFVELITVDHEVKVASDEDADGELDGYRSPSEGTSGKSPSLPPSGGGRGRKRKSSVSNSTPRKRGRPSLGQRKSSVSIRFDEDDDEDGGWD